MQAFIALLRKDLVLYFSNRRALVTNIVAPILIAAFFGGLFNADSKPAHVPIAVTDLDRSALSQRIVQALVDDPALDVATLDAAAAQSRVNAGKLRAALTLPAGFGDTAARAMFGGAKPEVTLVYDPSQSMALPLVRGLLAQHAMEQVARTAFSADGPTIRDLRARVAADAAIEPGRRTDLLAMFDSIAKVGAAPAPAASSGGSSGASTGAGFSMPFAVHEVEGRAPAARHYNGYAHSFAGMGVQFILFMGIDVAVGLLAMRRLGLWKRLRAAPLSRATLLGSRIASCAVIALTVFAVIYAVAFAVFGVRVEGSWPGFLAVLLAFAIMTASFGLLIAALGRTPEATRGLAILVTLLLVMLGGAWVPTFVFPAWLQHLSLFAPTRWAVDGLDAMTWRGQPFDAALAPVGVMLGFSLLFAAIAIARFDWEE